MAMQKAKHKPRPNKVGGTKGTTKVGDKEVATTRAATTREDTTKGTTSKGTSKQRGANNKAGVTKVLFIELYIRCSDNVIDYIRQ